MPRTSPLPASVRPVSLLRRVGLHSYGLLLALSIPLYYGLLFALLVFAASETAWLREFTLEGWPGWLALSLLTLLLVRVAVYLTAGVWSLVTPSQDEQPAPEGIKLTKSDQAELWEEIWDVGRRMHAPCPDEIYVSHRPECYAAELRWFGFSTHRRLVLVLGMPHLSVLSVAELKSIVAHELAHFGGGDTRLSVFLFRFLRTLDRFLHALDTSVERARDRRWRWFDPVYWYAYAYFAAIRHLSAPFSRYQELRADRRSARVFGSELAARTLLKEWQIQPRFDAAVASFCQRDGSEHIWTDAYSWFVHGWSDFSPEGYRYLESRLVELEEAGFWDTHPTMQMRLNAVRSVPSKDLGDDRPVRDLLDDFLRLAKKLHHDHLYRSSESSDTVRLRSTETCNLRYPLTSAPSEDSSQAQTPAPSP